MGLPLIGLALRILHTPKPAAVANFSRSEYKASKELYLCERRRWVGGGSDSGCGLGSSSESESLWAAAPLPLLGFISRAC